MFKVLRSGFRADDARLVADAVLTLADFRSIAQQVGGHIVLARKTGYVAARRAPEAEAVATWWNGSESTNVAKPGDWVVTNLTPEQTALRDRDGHPNTYVVLADRFLALYERTGDHHELGAVYRAKGTVAAFHLGQGFDIIAPWGERQHAPAGFLICNGHEVYGNNAETFAATYELLPRDGTALCGEWQRLLMGENGA